MLTDLTYLPNLAIYGNLRKTRKLEVVNWWLVRITLVVSFRFLSATFWEVVGTYELLFCLKRNAASVVLIM